MDWLDWTNIIGYLGAALTIGAYSMRSMRSLRIVAVCSNVFFLIYALVAWVPPVFLMQAVLLPLNMGRLWEIIVATRRLRRARSDDDPILALRPFLKPKTYKDGAALFKQGDTPNCVYYIERGQVHLPEVDVTLESGTLFGEMAFFAADRARTTSATCMGACRLLEIDEAAFMKVYQQHPEFGFYVIRLMAQRLVEGAKTKPEIYAGLADASGSASLDKAGT